MALSVRNTYQQKAVKPALYILTMLISLASVGSILPSPALSDIASAYGVMANQSEWVVSIFVLGYALSQIIYGPLSNSIGRKNTLYLGLGISITGGLICILAPDFTWLIAGRLIMSLGSGCGLNMTFTIINDYCEGNEARRMIAYVSSAFALLPGLAILLGGELTSWFGYNSCFIFLTLFNVVVLLVVYLLPETHPREYRLPLSIRNVLRQYIHSASNPRIYLYTLLWGCSTSIIYIVSATASIVAEQHFGLDAGQFARIFMIVMVCFFLGNIITARLSRRVVPRTMFYLGLAASLGGGVAMVAGNLLFAPHVLLFLAPLAMVYMGLPAIFTTASARAMQLGRDKSTTSSISSFMNMMIAFISSSAVSSINNGLYHCLPLIVLALVMLIAVLLVLEHRWMGCSS